ncbi:MAG TPA: PKD domain-containing protein [Candidatus Hydrogenedentes bacterium]|nr:PKD domain-containing protein [Candidatus Hydrogenedentota bacterium]HPG69176.1 PKD domain-containing protein [Candidatus Hydrogenedentota bacterium]
MVCRLWHRWLLAVAVAWALAACPADPDAGYTGPPLDKPIVDFSASPVSGTAPLTVKFTDKSYITNDLPLRSWQWTFGDGRTSLDRNPEHTYEASGVYSVSLTVAVTGTLNTKRQKDYINVSESSTASEESKRDEYAE